MIIKPDVNNIPQNVINYLYKDPARNYFIILGILDKKPVFKSLYVQYKDDNLTSVLFQRNSGSLQFYAESEDFDAAEIKRLISTMDYTSLISPYSYSHLIYNKTLFSEFERRAYICRLKTEDLSRKCLNVIKDNYLDINNSINILDINNSLNIGEKDFVLKPLDISMLDSLDELYKEVFSTYASKSIMKSRLSDKRGRGYVLYHNGRLISAVQSEFENPNLAVIVGVATSKAYQKRGLAGFLLELICSELLSEGKELYLQFDNSDAGRIYYKLGFKEVDRVGHYLK